MSGYIPIDETALISEITETATIVNDADLSEIQQDGISKKVTEEIKRDYYLASVAQTTVTRITSSQDFTPDPLAKMIEVICFGAGGGGGGANAQPSTSSGNAGGAGGGGGGVNIGKFKVSELTIPISITIGVGGTGGTGIGTAAAAGNGGVGGNTSFGSYIKAYGGGGGGGTSAGGSAKGGGGAGVLGAGGTANGNAGLVNGSAHNNSEIPTKVYNALSNGGGGGGTGGSSTVSYGVFAIAGGCGGGCGGGWIGNPGTAYDGAAGSVPLLTQMTQPIGGTGTVADATKGGNGTIGQDAVNIYRAGSSGAGGGNSRSGDGGNGGVGGIASGGGGGGMTHLGSKGGNGGNGGDGICIIVQYF